MNPIFLTDFYKVGHVFQYPDNTEYVYSNMTPRKSRIPGVTEMVVFGIHYAVMKYLVEDFKNGFFSRPIASVVSEYSEMIRAALGSDLPSYQHIIDLHELGYLPVEIKSLPEGTLCPMRVPFLTIRNTHPRFAWVTNFLETLLSAVIWQPCTSATLAYQFRKLLNKHAAATGMPNEFVKFQGHDFSFRGMSSVESAMTSGAGHLLSFAGTDTIPAILFLRDYYRAEGLIGASVPATEHSVMCAGGCDNEKETIRRLISKIYPTGIVSIVSDTWNLWTVLTDYLPALRDEILARPGKVVIRPDSGDPVLIMAGDPDATSEPERKGVIELLWDTFGGCVTPAGYRVVNPAVGAIYGDSINLDRANRIAENLAKKGFASQAVLGIGSYTYQYNTRDTFGIAMKATHVVIDGCSSNIFKTPVTDDGTKNSATGLLSVHKVTGADGSSTLSLLERCLPDEERSGELQTIFIDGEVKIFPSLSEIRSRLWGKDF